MTRQGEIFLDALGERSVDLHPEMTRQLSAPESSAPSSGVFARVGTRWGWIMALAQPVVGPGLLLTRFGVDVPFTLREQYRRDAAGTVGMDAVRTIQFRAGAQRFADRLVRTTAPHGLRTLLGDRQRIAVDVVCTVSPTGGIRMEATGVTVRIAGWSLRLPRLLSPRAELEDGWDDSVQLRTIAARIWHPLLGTLLEYSGTYRREAQHPAQGAA